jgi:Xaa-Pro dipeptidase
MTHPRLQKVYDILAEHQLDAVALIPGANMQYVTGADFHLMERPLVAFFRREGDPVAVVPSFEAERLRASGIPFELFPWSDTEGYQRAFEAAGKALHLSGKVLGVEELRMRVLEFSLIQCFCPGTQIVQAGHALAHLRLRKDEGDLAQLREAIAISEAALSATIEQVRPDMTEREIAGLLVVEQLKRGGGKHPFEPVVLSGPKAALPHGEPDDRRVAEGECLLFDFGTTVQGYASDITRTFSVGDPSPRLAEIYEVVRAANEAGRMAAGPGVPAQDVDRATRKVVEDAGFGAYFTHRTGHGLGLEAHENPNIVEGNLQRLEPGMVFTIEPGIYLPGEVGVRIEDNVVITPDGAQSLTIFPRELMRIGK